MSRGIYRLLAGTLAAAMTMLWAVPAHADATRDKQWHLGFLKMAEAWQISQGEGVTVAVVDTGIDATHPDLTGNVLPGTSIVSPPGDGLTDTFGHGTSMAGLIAAHGRGDTGAIGIAPKAKVMSVRAGIDKNVTSRQVANGVAWAAKQGVQVISVSYAGNDLDDFLDAVNAALAADIVVVAGVGNKPEQGTVRYPAAYPGVIAVAGVDQNGNHAAVSVTGSKVVLAAPATDILSPAPGREFTTATGTSDATAIVSGVAALVRSKYPRLSAKQVYDVLTSTAIDKGPAGRDPEYGYGIVDPVAALKKAASLSPAGASATASTNPTADTSTSSTGGNNSDSGSNHTILIVLVVGAAVVLLTGGLLATVLITRRTRRR